MKLRPCLLKLELTDKCNAKCVFCDVHRAEEKETGFMSFEVVEQAINEFPEIKLVHPYGRGESLLHPQILEILDYIKTKGKRIVIYTNGSLFNREIQQGVNEIGVDEIRFSVESDSKELYEKLRRGLVWETFLNNIESFQRIKSPHIKTVARVGIVAENYKQKKKICDFWKQKVDKVMAVKEAPFGRSVKWSYKYRPCPQPPWEQVIIRRTGEIAFCCMDAGGNFGIGTVKDGIRVAWSNDRLDGLRKSVNSENDPEICKICRTRGSVDA